MSQNKNTEIALWILAGIGAGTLIGAGLGMALGPRAAQGGDNLISDTVDEIKETARQVLGELSDNVTTLLARSRDLLHEVEQTKAGQP